MTIEEINRLQREITSERQELLMSFTANVEDNARRNQRVMHLGRRYALLDRLVAALMSRERAHDGIRQLEQKLVEIANEEAQILAAIEAEMHTKDEA